MVSPVSSSLADHQVKEILRAILSKRRLTPWHFHLTATQLMTSLDQLRILGWLSGSGESLTLTKTAREWLKTNSDDPNFPWLDELVEGRLDVRQQMAFPKVGQRTQANVWKRTSVQAASAAAADESSAGVERGFEP
ncbi:MAG: hypothetical protein EOP06_07195 [Proteobacteria bacterium]|nr:MAG: hypothetical protein EOP06_07195 [Pseudomonadota bacterium]